MKIEKKEEHKKIDGNEKEDESKLVILIPCLKF